MELRLLHLAQWLMVGFPDHRFLADSYGALSLRWTFFQVFGHLQVMWMSVNLGCILTSLAVNLVFFWRKMDDRPRFGYQDTGHPHPFWRDYRHDRICSMWLSLKISYMTYDNFPLANQLNQVQLMLTGATTRNAQIQAEIFELIFGLVKVLNQELNPHTSTRIELHRSYVRFPLSWLRLNMTQFSELGRESECQV